MDPSDLVSQDVEDKRIVLAHRDFGSQRPGENVRQKALGGRERRADIGYGSAAVGHTGIQRLGLKLTTEHALSAELPSQVEMRGKHDVVRQGAAEKRHRDEGFD